MPGGLPKSLSPGGASSSSSSSSSPSWYIRELGLRCGSALGLLDKRLVVVVVVFVEDRSALGLLDKRLVVEDGSALGLLDMRLLLLDDEIAALGLLEPRLFDTALELRLLFDDEGSAIDLLVDGSLEARRIASAIVVLRVC